MEIDKSEKLKNKSFQVSKYDIHNSIFFEVFFFSWKILKLSHIFFILLLRRTKSDIYSSLKCIHIFWSYWGYEAQVRGL